MNTQFKINDKVLGFSSLDDKFLAPVIGEIVSILDSEEGTILVVEGEHNGKLLSDDAKLYTLEDFKYMMDLHLSYKNRVSDLIGDLYAMSNFDGRTENG